MEKMRWTPSLDFHHLFYETMFLPFHPNWISLRVTCLRGVVQQHVAVCLGIIYVWGNSPVPSLKS